MDRILIPNSICLYIESRSMCRNHINVYGCSLQKCILGIRYIFPSLSPLKMGVTLMSTPTLPPRKKGLLQSCSQIQHCGDLRFRQPGALCHDTAAKKHTDIMIWYAFHFNCFGHNLGLEKKDFWAMVSIFLCCFQEILISILESSRCRICVSLAFSLSACHTPKTKGLNQKIRCCFIQEPLDLRVNQAYILPCTDPVKPLEAITAEKQARQNLIQRTFETCTSIAHHNWGVNLYWAKSCQSRVFVDINGINHLVKAFEALHVRICRKSFRHLNLGITSISSVHLPSRICFFKDSPHFLPFGISCVSRPWQLRSHVTVLEPEVKQTKFVKISLPNLWKGWRKHQNSHFKRRNH